MNKLDSVILERFQRISDWFQTWTGLTNFHLAKFCLSVSFFVATFSEVCKKNNSSFLDILTFAAGILSYGFILYQIETGEKECYKNKDFQSSLAIGLSSFRILLLYFSGGLFVGRIIPIITGTYDAFYFEAAHTLMFLASYFASCTPKPRSTSKIKEFIGKLQTKLVPQRV